MTSVFTHKHAIEGNVGIGKLPENLHPILDDISAKYDTMIPHTTDDQITIDPCDHQPLSCSFVFELHVSRPHH
jgi:hypothetical protein